MPRNFGKIWNRNSDVNDYGGLFGKPLIQYLIFAVLIILFLLILLVAGYGTLIILNLLFE